MSRGIDFPVQNSFRLQTATEPLKCITTENGRQNYPKTPTIVIITTFITGISSPRHDEAKQNVLNTITFKSNYHFATKTNAILLPFTSLYAKDDRVETH